MANEDADLNNLTKKFADNNPLNKVARDIGNMNSLPVAGGRDMPWPERKLSPKNHDVPRAGELSSQVFNDLTTRIITELQESVETQITDAINRRAHAIAQMESLKAEIDKVFGEYEATAKRHQEKVNGLAEAVQKKVKADTDEMMALSKRLQEFADSVNSAHDKFIKD
jgi:chromosome condensin MukBEF complex kleisin-like MukF subunit